MFVVCGTLFLSGTHYSGIYLGIIDEPSIYPGAAAFAACAILMATFSLRPLENKDYNNEEWDFEEDIQEAEMIEEKTTKKKASKKKKGK